MLVHAPGKGIALKLVSTVTFASMFALLRAAGELPAGELMFIRSAFGFAFLAGWGASRVGVVRLARIQRKGLLALTALLSATSMYANLVALGLLPLAIFATLTYLAPLFAVLVSAIALKERIGRTRALGLALGLCGAVLVASSGNLSRLIPSLLSVGTVFAVSGAAMAGSFMVMVRVLCRTEDTTNMAAYFLLASTIGGALTLGLQFVAPTPLQWAILIAAGLLGAISQFLLSFCYRFAEPSVLAPYEYAAIIWATLFGLLLFGELPTLVAAFGILLVIAAGLIVAWSDVRGFARDRAALNG